MAKDNPTEQTTPDQKHNPLAMIDPDAAELTAEDWRNAIAFGNRATMPGSEAEIWVALKRKFIIQLQRLEA